MLEDLVAVRLGRGHSARVIAFHQAVAERLGLNPTDLKTVDLVTAHNGTATAGQVAETTGLTSGAVTFAIDRLEEAGFLTRTRDPKDRRRWTLEVTPESAATVNALYAPLASDMRELTATFADHDLAAIASFIEQADELLARHTDRLRQGKTRLMPPRPRRNA